MTAAPAPEIASSAAALLRQAGVPDQVASIRLASAGGNNRLYRVDTPTAAYAVKQYFRHEGDTRDRLGAEFGFLSYASAAAPAWVPRPLALDTRAGMALYEFITGEPLRAGSIGLPEVDAAIAFFAALNDPATRQRAALPTASEASFSLAEHLRSIDGRVSQLLAAVAAGDGQGQASIGELADRWRALDGWVRGEACGMGLAVEEVLPPAQRCVSPSDFGFHNALRTADGGLRFLDFEYAGWDDPAKTAGDFFSQLAVPVPAEHFDHFVAGIARPFEDPAALTVRAGLLRPVYQVKWCCIALNVFLPVHLARRKFANPDLDEGALKQAQLAKAHGILQSIQEPRHGLH
ncbi:MAG TPA: aminoglycoside phosphotransferase family protein [Rhodocyclaceae bacterium]|nr:aminoglycoside phosphotransferase family protein [Rhodocyclaceae bacterium]